MKRREFVRVGAGLVASSHLMPVLAAKPPAIRAVAFDGFALFDATAIVPFAEAIVPGHGRDLVSAWRARHFEYQWLRSLGGQYADFQRTASDALLFATKSLALSVSSEDRKRLVEAQATLQPWPDAHAAVDDLRRAGIRLVLLSNMTERMLIDGLVRARLRDQFELVLSTDRARAAKPSPQAYAMGESALALARHEIAFVAFAGWDAAGATWFGYPTAWLNRSHTPVEELDATPSIVSADLSSIVRWITAPDSSRSG